MALQGWGGGKRSVASKEAEVEDVGAIVTGGHHADGDADAGFAGLVGRDEIGGTEQVVVGEVDGVLLGVVDLGRDLYGEIGLVLAGEHLVGHFVEDLGQLGGMVLADGKDNGFPDLTADRVA